MATITCFEDMESWKIARTLSKKLGVLIDVGRYQKNYPLIRQTAASVGSIMDYIAEGFERGTRAEFIMFLGYAKGSCGELRSQLYRAFDRNYLTLTEFEELKILVLSVSSLLQRLISYLQTTTVAGVRTKQQSRSPK